MQYIYIYVSECWENLLNQHVKVHPKLADDKYAAKSVTKTVIVKTVYAPNLFWPS